MQTQMHSTSLTAKKKVVFLMFSCVGLSVALAKNIFGLVMKRTYCWKKERIQSDHFLKKYFFGRRGDPATLKSAPITDRVVFQRPTRIWLVRFHQNLIFALYKMVSVGCQSVVTDMWNRFLTNTIDHAEHDGTCLQNCLQHLPKTSYRIRTKFVPNSYL